MPNEKKIYCTVIVFHANADSKCCDVHTLCCSLGYTGSVQDTVRVMYSQSMNLEYSDLPNTVSLSFPLWMKAECYQDEDLFHHSTYTQTELLLF